MNKAQKITIIIVSLFLSFILFYDYYISESLNSIEELILEISPILFLGFAIFMLCGLKRKK